MGFLYVGFLYVGPCDGLFGGGPEEGGHGGWEAGPWGVPPGAALLIAGANDKASKSKFNFIAK